MLPKSTRLRDIVRPYLAIEVGGDTFAVPVNVVHEIVDLKGVSLVLQPPDYRGGCALRRGRAIPVIDLRPEFAAKPCFTPTTRIVIAWTRPGQGERMLAGLLVDAAGSLLTICGDEVGESLEWKHHPAADFMDGCCERDRRSIPLINTDRLFASLFRRHCSVRKATI